MANPLRPSNNPDDDSDSRETSKAALASALLGFGAQMMQPPGWGQSSWGNFGQALGTAGQSAANVQKQQLAQEEAESKQESRAALASAAEERAKASAERTLRTGDLDAFRRQQDEWRSTGAGLGEFMKLQQANTAAKRQREQEQKDWEAAELLNPGKQGPKPGPRIDLYEPSLEDFMREWRGGRRGFGPGSTAPAATGLNMPTPRDIDDAKNYIVQHPTEEMAIRNAWDKKFGPGAADRHFGRK